VIHLEIGEPDFPTPPHIVEAAKCALDQGYTKYGPPLGLLALREAIAAYISRTRGIKVDAANVCVVPGGKPILFFTMTALLEPGDEVIYPNPGFPIYESMIRFLGATPVPLPADGGEFEKALSSRTKLVILNSPENPTGTVISREHLVRMSEILRDRDVMVLSDEIYSRIYYEEKPAS